MAIKSLLIGIICIGTASAALAPARFFPENAPPAPAQQPEELGQVHWLRDLEEGFGEAQKSGKPLLILFQEVPGCANCTRFGNGPLSHPLIVEAIETHFVPVCIFNNKPGADAAALKRFGEPSWNNPVVRIVRADGSDVVPRMANFNSSWQAVSGMRHALDLTGTAAPRWLEMLENELFARESSTETATFSMHCFWVGEGAFGDVEGVLETEPGFQAGKEVVRVVFNPAIVSRADLEAKTQPSGTTACAKNEGFRSDREPKYYLSKTHWRAVPMTPQQAARANSLVGKGQSPAPTLSPRQIALGAFVAANPSRKWPNAIGAQDLPKAWANAIRIRDAAK